MAEQWVWSARIEYLASEFMKNGVFESRKVAISAARAFFLIAYYPKQGKFYTAQLREMVPGLAIKNL